MKILLVAGARPKIVKIAHLVCELGKDSRRIEWRLAHTGQHYDYEMSNVFFDELEIPEPNYFLGGGFWYPCRTDCKNYGGV